MIGDAYPHGPCDKGNDLHLAWRAEACKLHHGMVRA